MNRERIQPGWTKKLPAMGVPMKFICRLMFGSVMFMANGVAAQNSVAPFHLDEATISDVHAAYKSGALTSVKLVQAYLERIRACDQAGPKLNVVIFLNPRALEEAAALDDEFRKTGKFAGPLHGIPVLLKDNVNTKDMPTTGGSLSLAGYTPATDAAVTQKLRDAGAIILAKVNLHEFAIWGETISSIQGQTLNPYDLARTPGGSSGGTGAGVAANFAIASVGELHRGNSPHTRSGEPRRNYSVFIHAGCRWSARAQRDGRGENVERAGGLRPERSGNGMERGE